MKIAIPEFYVTFWRPLGEGLELCADAPEATVAVIHSPTFPDGKAKFDLAADRRGFDCFMAGCAHGAAVGDFNGRRKIAALLGGVEVIDELPPIVGPQKNG